MKALVTGGAGFIGSKLVQSLLNKGHHVKVLDIQTGPFKLGEEPRLKFVGLGGHPLNGGMVDPRLVRKAVKGVDVIYHLAINWDGHSWKGELPLSNLFDSNIRGTINLLEAARSFRVKHFLFAGSIAVYGKRDSPLKDENVVCNPERWKGAPGPTYAIVKLVTERLCLMYHHQHGLPVTVFRIDVVFDDDEYQDLALETIRKIRRGEPVEVDRGEGGATVHVDDVARAFLTATLNKRGFGQTFNISNPAAYVSDLDVCRIVIKALDSKSRVKITKSLSLTGPKIQSVRKAEEILGWSPQRTRIDLESTITRMARDYGPAP